MKTKQKKLKIIQEGGVIFVDRKGETEYDWETEYRLNCNILAEKVKEGKITSIDLANIIAELIHDSLNCKSASATLRDNNEKNAYRGTYFENIDYMD